VPDERSNSRLSNVKSSLYIYLPLLSIRGVVCVAGSPGTRLHLGDDLNSGRPDWRREIPGK